MSFSVGVSRAGEQASAMRSVAQRPAWAHWLRVLPAAVLVPVLLAAAGNTDSPASNAAMEARLRSIFDANDWKADPNKPGPRTHFLAAVMQSGKLSVEQRKLVLPELANEYLRAGDPRGALQALTTLEPLVAGNEEGEQGLHELRALAYLRLGEQENCQAMHEQRMCVFPMQGMGAHKLPEGAEGAVRELTWLLHRHADDALSRWLLNVAYMQLGRYPAQVPSQFLLPPKMYDSEMQIGEFLDYASLSGVDVNGNAGGAIVEDFDGDGLLDIVTSSSGPLDPMHMFHNNGDGTFSDWSARAGLTSELGGLNLVLGDFDNDGHPDILVLRGGWWGKYGNYPLSLLRNCGDGTFEDVTEKAGLLHAGPTQTAAWADYDNDGWPDLFVGYESTPENVQPSLLYHNNHDGTFTEVGHGMPLGVREFVKGVAWGDFNNDGRPDLYISVREGSNRLLRNDGPADPSRPDPAHWRFTDVTAQAGVAPKGNTFATWFFDYDNDGWPDLYVSGYSIGSMQDVGRFESGQPFDAGLPHLYHNRGDGTFTEVTHAMHLDRAILPMGANFGDLDNDGWLDLYLGTGETSYQALLPNRMFRNDRGVRFQDVTTAGGFGHLQKGHAIAFADIENRGQEDVFEEMGGAFPGDAYASVLYRNPGHPGHSITLKLVGVESNRAAYGARIEVVFQENGRSRKVFRTVGAVSSFGGNPMEQHIGVGAATRVDEIRIRWPASYAQEQVLRNLPVDQSMVIREGSAAAEVAPRKAFMLGAARLPRNP
jgi:FG-GAP-like repeat/ASPIC and UnbV